MDMNECLLDCLRAKAGRPLSDRLGGLAPTDWEQIARLAGRHGIAPLLYHHLNTAGLADFVPAEVMRSLRQVYLYAAGENMRLYRDLAPVLQALHKNHIPVIALKGAHLAQIVYGNPALRSMVDIDLLVHKDDLGRAMEILESQGYKQHKHLALEADRTVIHHLPPLVKPGAVGIELHWTLVSPFGPLAKQIDPFAIDLDQVWQRAQAVTLAGVETQVLSPEDLLLHLCVHLAYHHWFQIGLRGLCDVAQVVQHCEGQGLNWERVQRTALQWRVSRCVYMALALSRELLAMPIPDHVLAALEPPDMDHRLTAQARLQVLNPQAQSSTTNVTHVWQAKRWQDKVQGLLAVAFPDRQLMATMYPAPARSVRIYLYYPVRIKDLFVRHGRTVWRLIRRDANALAQSEHDSQINALRDWLTLA
jgi:hypothetical protein